MELLMFGLGGQEIFLIFVIVLLLFGGNKIPELMRGLGRGIKEFNSARANVEDEIRKGMNDTDAKKTESSKEKTESSKEKAESTKE